MYKLKRTNKIIAVILTLALILLMPAEAFAAEAEQINEVINTMEEIQDNTEQIAEPEIIAELDENRDAITKCFELSNGNKMLIQYDLPVHFKDEKGKWTEYDNSMIEAEPENEDISEAEILSEEDSTEIPTESSENIQLHQEEATEMTLETSATDGTQTTEKTVPAADETTETSSAPENEQTLEQIPTETATESANAAAIDSDDNTEYKNKKSDVNIRLSKKSKQSNMIKVKANGNKVSWGYLNSNKIPVEFVSNDEKLTVNEKFTTPENVIKEAIYKEIFTNVDLQCFVSSVGVKENLILKDRNAQNEFDIQYKLNGLTAKQLNSNTIELTDKNGKAVYSITAPHMTDSNGKRSEDLKLTVFKQNGNKLTVKLSADKEWLNSNDRQYPVTIDPSFNTEQKWREISSTYADESEPNTTHSLNSDGTVTASGTLYAGTLNKRYRSYIKMNALPTLNKGDMIVGAYLNMHLFMNDFYDDMYVGLYHVNNSWDQATLTWNNQPACNSNAYDYEIFNENTSSSKPWHDFNVTASVKRWYNGEANNGVMLKAVDESTNKQCAAFYSHNYPETTPRPVFTLVYRNNKGIEDYWTYSSFNVGTAGTAYVNDYTGNLTFIHNALSTAGNRAPASIQHVFNNYMAGVRYEKSIPRTGAGWKLNYQQTVLPSSEYGLKGDSAEKYPYVYTDSDGTEHYFYKKTENGTTKYLDEDGLKLELKINEASTVAKYTIADEKSNKMEFNKLGNLKKIIDSNSNALVINYDTDNKTITSIKDGAGKSITYEKNSNGYITKMTSPGGKNMTYGYTGNKLTRITNNDGTNIKIEYDTDGSITSITDIDGYKVSITYDNAHGSKQVSAIQEYGTDGTVGQKITFDRSQYNQTVIQTTGIDGIYGTSDDVQTKYQFDEYGRTVSIINRTNSQDLGASIYKLTSGTADSSASNIKMLNRVSSEYVTPSNTANLIKNSSLESNSNWTTGTWEGSNTSTYEFTNTQKYFGQKSLKINTTAYTGDTKARAYQSISSALLKPGKTYTLSAYVKTQNITSSATDYGAGVCATVLKTDGTSTSNYSDMLKSTTDTTVNNGWRRVVSTFSVPSNVSSVRVDLLIRSATGIAYFDGIQFEESSVANNYNMLQNGDMENYSTSTGIPTFWYGSSLTNNSSNDFAVTTQYRNGKASYMMTGDTSSTKELYQTVPVSGSEDDTYIVGGWAKANCVADNSEKTRRFKISVKVTYSDGTEKWKESADFNRSVNSWQYSSSTFNLSDGTSAVKTPVSITVYLRYYRQCNKVYFDNIQLIKDATQSYTYNSEGELVTVVSNAEQKSQMEYSNSDLAKNIDAKGYAYTYDYDKNHNMTKATSQRGTTYNYTYDSYGNATALEAKNPAGTMSIKTTAEYTANGAFLSKVTDQNGNAVTYDYDQNNGTLKSASDSSGTVNYTYNSLNNLLTGVSKFVENDSLDMTTSYSYTQGTSRNLTQISHNGTNYNIEYDAFNNKTATKVGSELLASYAYNANNGLLKSISYGNGKTVSYTYDNYGNTSSVSHNGTTAFKWYSDKTGAVTRENDFVNNLQTNFDYDTTGRLVRQSTIDISKSASSDRTANTIEYSYDLNNNITRLVNITPDGTKKMNYSYGKDNLPEKFTLSSTRAVNYAYDGLGRTTSTTITTNTPVEMSYLYHTSKRNSSGSDMYRTTQVYREKIGSEEYKYTYDTLGNITKIELSTNGGAFSTLYEYEYDEASQLIAESDYGNNRRSMYFYDEGGNMTDETVHYFASGVSGKPVKTENISYDYTDSNWTDKLTSYKGQAITYDEIGNPLNYRDGIKMTWQNGRQLSALQQNGNNISYKYDSGGVRTSKTVNGEKWTYEYLNDKLLYETRGEKSFHYYYDANGMLYAVSYKLTGTGEEYVYYYSHNWRGDIVGLYNGNGELRAKYTYDAWGNVTSITDQNGNAITSKTHVGNLNPFRYRGYYQDTETGFYYLMSRYYDSTIHRFVNADSIPDYGTGIVWSNIFAYCINNPVMRADNDGHFAIALFILVNVGLIAYVNAKPIVSTSANAFLTVKGYNVANDMFQVSIWCGGNTIGDGTKDNMISKVKNNSDFEDHVLAVLNQTCKADYYGGHSNGYVWHAWTTFQFTEGDLYYAIQHCQVDLTGYKVGNVWHATVKLHDVYDFTEWRDLNSPGNIANDLGFLMQQTNKLSAYRWSVTFDWNIRD